MSLKTYAFIIAEIPLPNGGTRYQKVGEILSQEHSATDKGPGLVVSLDRTFNHAALPGHSAAVTMTTIWPQVK